MKKIYKKPIFSKTKYISIDSIANDEINAFASGAPLELLGDNGDMISYKDYCSCDNNIDDCTCSCQ